MKTESKKGVPGVGAGSELWLRMYRGMQMIRLFEEQVNQLYTRAVMPGLAHLVVDVILEKTGAVKRFEKVRRQATRLQIVRHANQFLADFQFRVFAIEELQAMCQ